MTKQCSVCDQAVGGALRAVSGPDVTLCEACYRRSAHLLESRDRDGVIVASGEDTGRRRCSFCGQRQAGVVGRLVLWPRVSVCTGCVSLMGEIYEDLDRPAGASARAAT
jgi:hypothetical protein